MLKTGLIYSDIYLEHNAPGHPESADRLVVIKNAVEQSDLKNRLEFIDPRMAAPEDIKMVHSSDYVQQLQQAEPGYLDGDTYFNKRSFEVALYAAGGVMEAIDKCRQGGIRNTFCAVRPPGHHAEKDIGMGFCIFNNIAVGARYARNTGYQKVFIIDFDVHHGNGTQHIFYNDDTVFYFSTHQYPHYPGTGAAEEQGSGKGRGFTRNFPLPHGAGDKEYLQVYQQELPVIIQDFDPDIILVSAGYDLYEHDPLAGMSVSQQGIRKMVQSILHSKKNIPCVFVLEGGYNLQYLGKLVVITLDELIKA